MSCGVPRQKRTADKKPLDPHHGEMSMKLSRTNVRVTMGLGTLHHQSETILKVESILERGTGCPPSEVSVCPSVRRSWGRCPQISEQLRDSEEEAAKILVTLH